MNDFFSTAIETLLDPWIIFGFVAQFLFFGRFIIQLMASEKAKKVVMPVSFWYLSIVGASMLLVYAIRQKDIVFSTGQFLALMIYVRNLWIHRAEKPTEVEINA